MAELFHLIGFVLAHASLVVTVLQPGELLVPFAIIERADGTREMRAFEAATQQEAIQKGKLLLANPPRDAVRIAFVRDGLLRDQDGTAKDTLSVTGWQRQQPDIIVSQTYTVDTRHGFKLLGKPFIALGEIDNEALALAQVHIGISEHPRAGGMWAAWGGTAERP